jgi:anti-sigma regulatory factor (Ser/Thr protein kinase)
MVVTELATNAVVHAASNFDVALVYEDGVVRIGVTDSSPLAPTMAEPGPESMSGRGLAIVDSLSTEWGYDLGVHGKQVWAQLAR